MGVVTSICKTHCHLLCVFFIILHEYGGCDRVPSDTARAGLLLGEQNGRFPRKAPPGPLAFCVASTTDSRGSCSATDAVLVSIGRCELYGQAPARHIYVYLFF